MEHIFPDDFFSEKSHWKNFFLFTKEDTEYIEFDFVRLKNLSHLFPFSIVFNFFSSSFYCEIVGKKREVYSVNWGKCWV